MKYTQVSEKTWVVEVQQDEETKEMFLEFPHGSIDSLGWDIGDTLLWEQLPDDGGYILRKKDDDNENRNEENGNISTPD